MKKILSLALAVILLVSLVSGCGQNEPAAAPVQSDAASTAVENSPSVESTASEETVSNIIKSKPDGENWSIFVYLCGTDLESNGGMATINLQEMLSVNQTENVKVIVQTGGTKTWKNNTVNAEQLGRYEIAGGKITLIEEQPLASMGSADTLGSFLEWGVSSYPADKYMCLLWNHGGGSVGGVAYDELYESDSLDVSELAAGIAKAGVEFEVIGFDTCLMSTIETAAAICPYGRFMVASEEIEPGTGWDYTAWLQYICDNPTADGLAAGTAICDTYFAKCQTGQTDDIVTLSVTKLSEIPKLVNAFDQMATELKEIVAEPSKYQPFAKAMSKAESYGGNNDTEGYTNMVDLGDLVRQSSAAFTNSGSDVLSALESAVKYKINGSGRQQSSGLSMFVPLQVDEESLNKYANTAAVSGNYLRFFESIFDWAMPSGLEIKQPVINNEFVSTETITPSDLSKSADLNAEDYKFTFHTELDDNGSYKLIVDEGEDIVQNVAFNLYYEDDNGEALFFLGTDYDLNYDETTGIYSDNFRNVWPMINGQTCSMMPLDFNDEYILYTVPIKLNGEETNLRMIYDIATSAYSAIGTWAGIEESGMSSKEIRPLVDGDKVEFLFSAADYNSQEPSIIAFGGFTVDGPVVVEEAQLFDAKFFYEYEITDIFGKTYTSDMAVIISIDGEITIEKLSDN